MTKLIRVPFADNGDRVEVPLTQQSDGSVSYSQGYTPNYELDPNTDASARRVERTSMNQIFHDVSDAVRELQVSGVAPWITAADNGGTAFSYGKGVVVLYNEAVYQSVKTANVSTPGANNDWVKLSAPGDIRSAVITSNGSFTVPAGVTTLYLSACAGGGGGGSGATNNGGQSSLVGGGGGGGGGAGQFVYKKAFAVTPGQVIPITVGGAGAGAEGSAAGAGKFGGNGGSTVVGTLVTLAPGLSGAPGQAVQQNIAGYGGAGGAGGNGYPNGQFGSDGNYTGNGGNGASSPFGGGGNGARAATGLTDPGGTAFGFGGGGGGSGGGYGQASVNVPSGPGGNGAQGIVIIEW